MDLRIFDTYKNKKVLITGNTGFKGSWLTMMLLKLGAKVSGYALEPPTSPSLYEQINIGENIEQYIHDIRSYNHIHECLKQTQPDFIFHLAAQALVLDSYKDPIETFEVNVMGTAYLLEAVRDLKLNTKVICVTSDKCYENREWLFGYREEDAMGGFDPYSASKGSAELIISSYRRSYFNPDNIHEHGVYLASVRAGNVIGGGDWAKDRIVPDCIRSLEMNERIFIRNPIATRPWQHVLEPLTGYLVLGSNLCREDMDPEIVCSAFNFGPLITSNKAVGTLVKEIVKNWGSGDWYHEPNESHHEASLLNLTIDKAMHLLKWQPVWGFKPTVDHTISWYKARHDEENMLDFTLKQIDQYLDGFAHIAE